VQRQVLMRMVGRGETGFLGRSSDLDRSSGNRVRVYETGLGFATHPLFIPEDHCIGPPKKCSLTEINIPKKTLPQTMSVSLNVQSSTTLTQKVTEYPNVSKLSIS